MKKNLKTILIIIFNSALIFATAEIALGLVFSEKAKKISMEVAAQSAPAYEFNEDYLYSLKPNLNRTFTRAASDGGNVINWSTNSHSFRGGEITKNRNNRIMIYGDSNILAVFSSRENTFSFRLEKYIEKHIESDVEVINAGVGGFGPDQNLIRFNKEAETYRPELVIFHVFADNDYGDIIRNNLFRLNQDGQLVQTKILIDKDQVFQNATSFKISSLLTIKAVRKLLRGIREMGDDDFIATVNEMERFASNEYAVYKNGDIRSTKDFSDHYDIDIVIDPQRASSVDKVGLMGAVLKKVKADADSRGIDLVVLIQPSIIDVTSHNSVLGYTGMGNTFPKYDRTRLSQEIVNICNNNNIPYFNLFEDFDSFPADNLYFVSGDDHWNDVGQDVAADKLAKFLLKRGHLNQLKN